ncbi:5-formyltetrahydrofolate cyclo-ligase [Chitinasiproducens palmae]|uniref:5-formyltetrahydrofolate cyclo-ligase n=1 Tax=Chitinasiproducens palmae TaxID=1770053 RepID=A0A1H2PV64_9BURK|nr:5-formyltetrahydrofolate cyclo-ligase [Chitinasiproducens palmae]SDV50324.1 5,10-methenyltetrahydrofolate synthetase [Chitinasiproducens palmae]
MKVDHESAAAAASSKDVSDAVGSVETAADADAKLDKRALRTALLAVRQQAGAHDTHLAHRLYALLEARAPRCVAFYWPLAGEFDARETIAAWLAAYSTASAALPVVTRADAPLAFHRWHHDSPMTLGRYRIPVPADAVTVTPDLLLIPCVGFDARRFRLGYGGGFYDRTLAALSPRPLTVGIAFDRTEVEALPGEAHDIPLDIVLTESRTLPDD